MRRSLRRAVPEPLVVAAILVRVEWLLRRRTLPEACRHLGITLGLDGAAPAGPVAVLPRWTRRPARWTSRLAAAWPYGDTCLRRCLVLGARISGLDPVLRIGVAVTDGRPGAHAWLEVGGRPLEGNLAAFAPLGPPR